MYSYILRVFYKSTVVCERIRIFYAIYTGSRRISDSTRPSNFLLSITHTPRILANTHTHTHTERAAASGNTNEHGAYL